MIGGVIGVIIWTEDLARLSKFYKEVLRLTPYSVHDGFIAFKFGGMRLNLGYHSEV